MKRFLLASLATGALALAAPAWAQTADPVPANPPIEQPDAAPNATEQPLPAAPPPGEVLAQPEAPTPDAQVAGQASPADPPAASEAPNPAMPASAEAVCQPRVTSVHFGQRGAALTLENRNAIEYAVDAASVCNLEQVVISDSAEGRTSDRRTESVRATLVERGVPEGRIVVTEDANAEGAATGQLDVRMTFAGVAISETPTASLEGAEEEPAG
jgi:outer membrane protein OmpA-like peptidoglycan-associated protein